MPGTRNRCTIPPKYAVYIHSAYPGNRIRCIWQVEYPHFCPSHMLRTKIAGPACNSVRIKSDFGVSSISAVIDGCIKNGYFYHLNPMR